MSRSVAFSESSSPSAFKSTLARIGMVLRRSTTRWTWLSALRRFARSILTRMISIRGARCRISPILPSLFGHKLHPTACEKTRARESRGVGTPSPPEEVGVREANGRGGPLIRPRLSNRRAPLSQVGFADHPSLKGRGCECASAQSWIMRRRSSISCFNASSAAASSSTFRTACRTVVWSRPPNRLPISGKDRGVMVLARYIAIWRGRTMARVRRAERRSCFDTL